MPQQERLMKFDPATGNPRPYPSNAKQWRDHHGKLAWLVNPWTEEKRDPGDIGRDPFGLLIVPPGEQSISIKIKIDPLKINKSIRRFHRTYAISALKTEIGLCGDDIEKVAVVCNDFAKANARQ